ncbi:MAG: response regulator [Bacteroidales bacterium]
MSINTLILLFPLVMEVGLRMAINQDSIFNELKLRIKLLEKQNNLKAELMEERLLLWLVSDTIHQAGNRDELFFSLLERIAAIREVPYSICCRISNNEQFLLSSYSAQTGEEFSSCLLDLSPELISKLKVGPIFLNQDQFELEGLKLVDNSFMQPYIVSIFPFQSLYIPFGFFAFAESKPYFQSLASMSLVVKQVIHMAIEKLDKLTMLEELKSLNVAFENKLRERIDKLNNVNEELKKEIHVLKSKGAKDSLKPISSRVNINPSVLSNISHEIRTPLNGILGFSELLRENGIAAEEKDNFINIIKSCGKSLLKIVDDVIDYSKIESDQIAIKREDFSIAKFMTEIYDYFKNDELFRQREQVELRLNINVGANNLINADPKKLRQVLENLIGNAIKFTEKGYIEIGCKLSKEDQTDSGNRDIVFFVKDTGTGIEDEMKGLIFDEFFKIEHDISRLVGGTGLGLTIAKHIVEMSMGKIWFESEYGVGSEFYFTLPEAILPVPGTDKPITAKEIKTRYKWAGKKVLIVEDDEMSYVYLKEVLKSTKVEIFLARSGREAVEVIKKDQGFDLILMDIKLPEMDGFEATRRIKEIKNSIPVIAQTAYAMADDHQKSLEVGCDGYISKPINRRKLLQAMEILIQ